MRYEIKGETLPVVVCYLEGGEQMITERGSMSWMSPNMKMETTTGGGIGKAIGRMFAGEALFQNRYTAQGGNGSRGRSGAVCIFPEKTGIRLLRRRRIHHAAAFRTGNGVP